MILAHFGGGFIHQNFKIGPARSLEVFAGDQVDMEVWTYYENSTGFGTTTAPINTLITAIAGAFGGVSGGMGESGAIYNGVSTALGNFGVGGSKGNNAPGAYLNYILFDKQYNVLDMGWTAVPTTALNSQQKISIPTVTAPEAGYMFIYLSYESESNNYVQFDDFKVTHTKTRVVQYNEYYPFGLQTANSWTRENSTNNFLYNAGSELNNTTANYEMFYREYDPSLGRMNAVDPMASKYASLTPYNYAFNDPTYFNDPSGADPDEDFRRLNAIAGGNMEYLDASSGMYGSAFPRYGVGVRNFGQMDPFLAFMFEGSRQARERRDAVTWVYDIDIDFNELPENSLTYLGFSGSEIISGFQVSLRQKGYKSLLASSKSDGLYSQDQNGMQRPAPIDIWAKDRQKVFDGLVEHLWYMGHNRNEAHHLSHIVQSLDEPVNGIWDWFWGVITDDYGGPKSSGVSTIFDSPVEWVITGVGSPGSDKWKDRKVNRNLTIRSDFEMDRGSGKKVYPIFVWGGGGNNRVIELYFFDRTAWDKMWLFLNY